MAVLEKSLRESLLNTAQNYHNQLKDNPDAMAYWAGRGLTEETVRRFGLGFVDEPAEEADASFKGRLSIPYLRYSAVHGATCVGFKFRSFGDDKPKYLYRKGLNPRLFNTAAIQRDTEFICVAEGEVDAISAEQAGLPCIGIPGATQWEDYFSRLFVGYRAVYFLQDNDEAGEAMAEAWASVGKKKDDLRPPIQNLKIIVMNKDVNSDLVEFGEDYLKEKVGEL